MNDEIKLIGLEKISLRFNLLRRLALNDNPIQATAARELLLNKYARRAGGWFELILIIIEPSLILVIFLPGLYLGAFALLGIDFIGNLIGIFLLTYPIVRIIQRDFDSRGLRYTILNSKEILSGLLQVQAVSYLLPLIIGSLLSAYAFYQMIMSQGSLFGGIEFAWSTSLMQAVDCILTGIIMVLLSIIIVLKVRNLWGSFAWLIVMNLIVSLLPAYTFGWVNPIGIVAIFMVLWAGLIFFAYKSVRRAVMPGKN